MERLSRDKVPVSTERTERDEARGIARRTALISVGVRVALVVLKYVFAVLSGSMALMADAVHNVTDIAQALALYLGVRISSRKSSAFPYGLYKLENLISLGVAVVIGIVGYELARNAIVGARHSEISSLPWTIGAMVVAMVGSFAFSRYEAAIARRTGSPALEADSREALIDALATLTVLASLIAAWAGYNIDLWATLIIVLFIAWTSAELAVDAIRVLLDASVDRELLNSIQARLEADPAVVEVRDLKGRNSGPYRFIEAQVVLDVYDLEEAHQVSFRLENAIREMAANIDSVMIHFEPRHRETIVYAVPVNDHDRIADHFGEADRFVLITVGSEDRGVRAVRYLDNPFRDEESGKGIRIARMLIEEGVDAVFVREDLEGKGPWYAFEGEHVSPIVTDAESLSEALEREGVRLEVPVDGERECA